MYGGVGDPVGLLAHKKKIRESLKPRKRDGAAIVSHSIVNERHKEGG